MQQKLFALSLGFGGLILATHHAFAAISDPQAGPARSGETSAAQTTPAPRETGTWPPKAASARCFSGGARSARRDASFTVFTTAKKIMAVPANTALSSPGGRTQT